jgi:hypothetical protein
MCAIIMYLCIKQLGESVGERNVHWGFGSVLQWCAFIDRILKVIMHFDWRPRQIKGKTPLMLLCLFSSAYYLYTPLLITISGLRNSVTLVKCNHVKPGHPAKIRIHLLVPNSLAVYTLMGEDNFEIGYTLIRCLYLILDT